MQKRALRSAKTMMIVSVSSHCENDNSDGAEFRDEASCGSEFTGAATLPASNIKVVAVVGAKVRPRLIR